MRTCQDNEFSSSRIHHKQSRTYCINFCHLDIHVKGDKIEALQIWYIISLSVWRFGHPWKVSQQSALSQFWWVMIICSGDALLLMIMKDMRGDGWGWGVRALCDTDANKRGREIHKIHHHAAISILISIIIAFNSRVRSSFHRFKHHHQCTGLCVCLGGPDGIKECSKVSSPCVWPN